MREFTKSVFRMPLAVSLLGIEQIANVIKAQNSGQSRAQTTAAINAVADAAQEQLSGTFKEAYRTGEQLQKNVVDTVSSVLKCESCGEAVERVTKTIRDTVARGSK